MRVPGARAAGPSASVGSPRLHWIDTADALAAFCQRTRERLALDTEFIRRDSYRARLGLIQLADDDGDVALIDPTVGLDLAPLVALLAHATWVLHAAGEDLDVLREGLGVVPPALVDTQLAASLLGAPTPPALLRLLEQELAVTLDKSQTRSDWLRRPLDDAQIAYAVADVAHLLALADRQHAALAARGLSAALAEECARLLARSGSDDRQPHLKLSRVGEMPVETQRLARRLLLQRERMAQQRDRPRGWILDNALLLAAAERQPADAAAFRALAEARQCACPRNPTPWLELLRRDVHGDDGDFVPAQPMDGRARERFKALRERARTLAEAQGLAADLLAPRRVLEALARGERPEELNGWRSALLAPLLQG